MHTVILSVAIAPLFVWAVERLRRRFAIQQPLAHVAISGEKRFMKQNCALAECVMKMRLLGHISSQNLRSMRFALTSTAMETSFVEASRSDMR